MDQYQVQDFGAIAKHIALVAVTYSLLRAALHDEAGVRTQGNRRSDSPSISADGRYVAFTSLASNLVPGDTNGEWDVFLHDRWTGETWRVSIASDGDQANGGSWSPSISADGRSMTFSSEASNLVPGDTNGHEDIYLHDRRTGETTRLSVAWDGVQANADSSHPSISADGRFMAFCSAASNLVQYDHNDSDDVLVHDRLTGATWRISETFDGKAVNGHVRSAIPRSSRPTGATWYMKPSLAVPRRTRQTTPWVFSCTTC